MHPSGRPELADLTALPPARLAELLEEEKSRWLTLFHWDFSPLAELILRYASMGTLDGFALMDGDTVAGYTYFVSENDKGLVGDLFVRDAWRSPANESLLLGAVIDRLRSMRWLRRAEAQLMHLAARGGALSLPGAPPAVHARQFMLARLERIPEPVSVPAGLHFERWSAYWLDAAARLIAETYHGHIDSAINNQYKTAAGARRFLDNIVRYPGCGYFAPDCSWVAVDHDGGVVGACFASRIAPLTGHIAQICVAPAVQGRGAGAELLRRSLAALRTSGAAEASLTVTSSNTHAIRLYERFAFRAIHQFDALVWDPL